MSTSGLTNQFIPSTLDGLVVINADAIAINGQDIDIDSLVPYTGANKAVNLGSQPIKTNYAPIADADLVNLLTLQNAVAYIEGINVANFVKYTGSNQNVDLANNNLTVNNLGQVSFSNLIKTELNNVLAGYNPASITVGNNFGTITNAAGVYQSTSTAVFASLVLGAPPAGEKYIVSLSLKSVDVSNNTNLYLYGSTTPNMTGSTGQIVAFSIPPNTTGFTVFTNTITFPLGSTYLLLVYFSQKPSGIDTLYWNAFSVTGMGSVVKNLIAPSTGLDATNKNYVDTQDNAVANFASATYVGYTNSFKDVDLTVLGNYSLKGYQLTATNKVIAPTAQFTGITSATPTLALGVDGSGNLNTFAVPSATNILPLNNTFTGTNTFNNNVTTGDGYTNNFGDAVFTGVNAITTGTPTTTGISAAAPTPVGTLTYSVPTYTMTPSGSLTFACFWASGTFTPNFRYFFTFTNATTSAYTVSAQITVCQANTANTAYTNISTAYTLPSTSSLLSGYFTPNINASYTGQIFFVLSNVKFISFSWQSLSYGTGQLTVQGNELITGTTKTSQVNLSGITTGDAGIQSELTNILNLNLNFRGTTTTAERGVALRLDGRPGVSPFQFYYRPAGSTTETLVACIDTNGNFGIGTIVPQAVLDVSTSTAVELLHLLSGTYANMWIGASGSFRNCGTILWRHIGNGSSNNYLGIGAYAADDTLCITAGQNVGIGKTNPDYKLDILGQQRINSGDNSFTIYQPTGGTWNATMHVGSGTNRGTAQAFATDGNLHLDAQPGKSMYYGYYPYAAGNPNPHRWYGGNYIYQGIPQNDSPYSHVVCMNGESLRRSQCMQRRLYQNGSVAWGGGINITSAFYKFNQTAVVRISGKYSGYWTGSYMAYVYVRIYSQSTGGEWGLYLPTFTNNGYNHVTVPFDIVYDSAQLPATGWFDLYMANSSGYNTDGNDQMTINVSVLPVDAF